MYSLSCYVKLNVNGNVIGKAFTACCECSFTSQSTLKFLLSIIEEDSATSTYTQMIEHKWLNTDESVTEFVNKAIHSRPSS